MRSIVLVLVIVLAGCTANEQGSPAQTSVAPPLTGDEPPTNATSSESISLQSCHMDDINLQVPRPLVDAEIPDGYVVASSFGSGALASVAVMVRTCDAVSVGDIAVQGPVRVATIGALVRADESAPNAQGIETYAFEIFTDSPNITAFLAGKGWPIADASIMAVAADTLHVTIASETIHYEFTGMFRQGSGPGRQTAISYYHDGVEAIFMKSDIEIHTASTVPYIVQYQGDTGVLGRISAGTDTLAGIAGSGPSEELWTFSPRYPTS